MKLAVLVPRARTACVRAPSGGDIYDAQLARALVRRGHHVDVVHTRASMSTDRLAARLLAQRYDALVQDELGYTAYLALNRALAGRLPAFALVHVTSAQLAPGGRTAAQERAFIASVQGSVFVSRHVRRETQRLLGLRVRGLVLAPGSDHLPRAQRRSRLQRRGVRFLCVAHLLPHKGQRELVELFARVPASATLTLAGDTTRDRAYTKLVRRAVERVGNGRVRLVGALGPRALAGAYVRADVCVSSSHYESYGMALAEALVHGLPVVAWTAGGLWEFLTPGVNAVRVRAGDAQAFADALSGLCENQRQLSRLQRAAAASARELPTWDGAARQLEHFLARRVRAARRDR